MSEQLDLLTEDPNPEILPTRLIGLTGLRVDRYGGRHGTAGAGKDTVADYLYQLGDYYPIALSDPIKDALEAMFDLPAGVWDRPDLKEHPLPSVNTTPRYLAQTLGTEWGREVVRSDLWLLLAEQRICKFAGICSGFVITDIRFDNEAQWIKERGGEVVRVVRPAADSQIDNAGHGSESGVADELVDVTIDNVRGFGRLFRQARALVAAPGQ
jgi:hypothetical protein